MDNIFSPFTSEEWKERRNHRSFDMVKGMYGLLGVFFAYRAYGEWPVVWC